MSRDYQMLARLPRRLLSAFVLLQLLLFSIPALADKVPVIIAVHEDQRLRFVDPHDLKDVGEFVTPHPIHRVIPAENTLFLEVTRDHSCCTLFSLDLDALRLQSLVQPTGSTIVSGDGRFLLTQRGDTGVEVFDAVGLEPLPSIAVRGIWSLYSDDHSSLVLGTTNDGPAMAIFDPRTSSIVGPLRLKGRHAQAVWMSDGFHILSLDGGRGWLWSLAGDSLALNSPVMVELPGPLTAPGYLSFRLLGLDDRLFIYELFGYIGDRRTREGSAHTGGLIELDPSTGAPLKHLVPDLHPKQVLAVPGQRDRLFVLDVGNKREEVRLVEIDSTSGAVLQERRLEAGNWAVVLTKISQQRLHGSRVQTSLEQPF